MTRGETFEASVEGGVLVGRATGDGPPVVFLHGGPGMSDYLEPLAALIADAYRVITYQQRGVAPSTLERPYTVEQHVADLVALLDHLGLQRASVVGHSWGGHLALFLLTACPERLDHVVVLDGVGAYAEQMPLFEENMTGRLSAAEREEIARIEALQEAGTSTEADEQRQMRLVWPYYHANPAAPPPFVNLSINPRAFGETYESMAEHLDRGSLRRRLPYVPDSVTTTILHGERSPLPGEFLRRTAALIPKASFVELPATGHFPWLEDESRTEHELKSVLPAPGGNRLVRR
jgi:pimeloyl-ACP methyl ester carboxylesterase